MPIDAAEFEKGEPSGTMHTEVLWFLGAHATRAHTLTEIGDGIDRKHIVVLREASVAASTVLWTTLENLIVDGRVESRRVNNKTYYRLSSHALPFH